MSKYINLAVPFFSQRENTYIWYERWNKDVFDAIQLHQNYSLIVGIGGQNE